MSEDDPIHDAMEIRPSKRSGGGGGGFKWLLGAGAAAIVLLGGGYWAWKNLPSSQSNAEIAAIDPYGAEPSLDAGSTDAGEDVTAETAATDESAAATPRASPRAAAVPEATIGVTPANAATEEAATEDHDDLVVTAPRRPIWARTPSPRRLASYYPERALDRGREGEARLHCIVQAGGALDCERVSETPGGGFGTAAMRVARTLRHAPTRADGSNATGTPVNLRVVFRMADEENERRLASR